MTISKPLFRSLVPSELETLVLGQGQPGFRATQLSKWLFKDFALTWEQMSNLPESMRQDLFDKYDLNGLEIIERLTSADGTRKFLFQLRDGEMIESVIIPMADHPTFCISSQVGCAMACRFCATAKGGLVRNLSAGEIIEQVLRLQLDLKDHPIEEMGGRHFNVVFMGMGEPLDNWPEVDRSLCILMDPKGWGISGRRIQVSTSGHLEGLQKLASSNHRIGLTLSLGGSNDQERKAVMPVTGKTPLTDVMKLASDYGRKCGQRVTLAWVLVAGTTDFPEQATRLANLARSGPFKINLIPLNKLDGKPSVAPVPQKSLDFQRTLTGAGIDAFLRSSGGSDIDAACGQLRNRRK